MKNLTSGGNTTNLKVANRQSIFHLLLKMSPLTKQEISRITSLSFSTVSNLISEMQQENFVRETGMAESGGGRRATLYELNPLSNIFIGIEIQVERICLVLLGANGSVLDSYEEGIDVSIGPAKVVEKTVEFIRNTVANNGFSSQMIAGIGVSIPGPIDQSNQIVLSPPNMPGWRNVPLLKMLEDSTGLPCLLEKDANAAAFGESNYGAGKGIDNLLYVMVDAGIGGAIIIDGEIYRGAFNDGGDIGHIKIDLRGPKCNCGGTGCLEAISSGLSIQRDVFNLKNQPLKPVEIFALCERDVEIKQIVNNAAEYLGYGIGGLTNALNTSVVILGGSLMEKSDFFLEKTIETLKQQILPEFSHLVRIERPKFGSLSGAIGAGMLSIHRELI